MNRSLFSVAEKISGFLWCFTLTIVFYVGLAQFGIIPYYFALIVLFISMSFIILILAIGCYFTYKERQDEY